MFMIYDLTALVLSLFFLPLYLLRRKFHRGFLARLGLLPRNLNLTNPIWVHAVSLGEAKAVKGLVEGLRKIYPEKKFVISTVTTTGNKVAKAMVRKGDLLTYLPLDFSFIIRSVIDRVNPAIFIIAETEIWPNLITCLYRRNIPVVIVNGRISDHSFQGYRCIKFLLRPILKKVTLFCVQTDTDRQRLMALGVAAEKIRVNGNMKFDLDDSLRLEEEAKSYRNRLGLTERDRLLVCGSTHPREEELLLGAYQDLLKDYPGLRLLIAARHPERSAEIEALVQKKGFTALRLSLLDASAPDKTGRRIFILDSVGELMRYYAAADIVFIGGSLVRKGGHNILEPAALAKPVVFGPYMFNFRDITGLFLKNQAALLVHSGEELKLKLRELLDNPLGALNLGSRGQRLILDNRGATPKNIESLTAFLSLKQKDMP